MSEELHKRVIEHGQVDNRPLNPDGVMPIFNGETGQLLMAAPTPNSIRLHRRNFLRIISADIDVRVRVSHTQTRNSRDINDS